MKLKRIAAPLETHADKPSPPVGQADAAPNWTAPYIPGYWSFDVTQAKRIWPSDPKNYFFDIAKRVIENGGKIWIK